MKKALLVIGILLIVFLTGQMDPYTLLIGVILIVTFLTDYRRQKK